MNVNDYLIIMEVFVPRDLYHLLTVVLLVGPLTLPAMESL
jgi:hypothetical protein